jgi:2-desacetyl-2-hydroxyethyl bacteriochlorophyllide A dehydrogenase
MGVTRGALFAGPQSLEVREVALAPLGEEDVLVRVAACGVCGSDLHQFFGRWPRPDVIPGHEVGGTVEEVGSGVTDLQPGDPVTVEPIIRCGECRYCLTGHYLLCERGKFVSMDTDGGFADYMVVPAYCCHKLPSDVDPELGAFGEPLSVGLHAVRRAAPTGADTVLLLGAGTIGLLAAAAAKALGAGRVLITAKHEHQAEAAWRLGVNEVLSPGEDLPERVKRICPEGADVVIETVGTAGGVIEQALQAARKLGTVVLVGGITDPSELHLGPIIHRELTVLGSPCYGQLGVTKDFEIAADLIANRKIDVSQLISGRYALDDIQSAFLAAADKKAGALKVLVKPSEQA